MAHLRPLIAGNWKMNGVRADLEQARRVRDGVPAGAAPEVMICPPATLIADMARLAEGSRLTVGAQDCHWAQSGAHTGDLSAEMIRDAGGIAVIVGHSERRADHGETDGMVRAKAEAAYRAGLIAIICLGETAGQRQAGLTLDVVHRQLAGSVPDGATAANTVIAYEPVWAIGTGLTPTPEDVARVHAGLRAALEQRFGEEGAQMRILYGGSVKPDNASALLAVPNVNGALVGGASLKANEFLSIVASCGR
jgi:triosephosphate isomerase